MRPSAKRAKIGMHALKRLGPSALRRVWIAAWIIRLSGKIGRTQTLPAISGLGDQETMVTQPSRADLRAAPGTSKDSPMVFEVTEHRALTDQKFKQRDLSL